MYWHHKDDQIAVFCDVVPHAVADMYTFQQNPLPPHSGSLTQKTPRRTPCCCCCCSCWVVGGGVGRAEAWEQ